MDINKCLAFNQIYNYISNKSDKTEAEAVETQIRNCESCAEEYRLILALYNSLEGKPAKPDLKSKLHFTDSEFQTLQEKYFQKDISKSQLKRLYTYLANSPSHFKEFSYLAASDSIEILPDEKVILSEIENAVVRDRVSVYEQYFKKQPEFAPISMPNIRYMINNIFSRILESPKLAMSFAGALVVCLLFYLGYQKYSIDKMLNLADRDYAILTSTVEVLFSDIRPSNSDLLVLFKVTRSEDTIKQYTFENIEKVLELKPRDAKYNHYLGTINFFNGHIDEAEKFYYKALDADPNYAQVYNDLALVNVDKADFDKALLNIKKALKLNPDFIEAHHNLAVILELMGKTKDAIEAWEQYLAIEKNDNWKTAAKTHVDELK